jgi:hypothetical protein
VWVAEASRSATESPDPSRATTFTALHGTRAPGGGRGGRSSRSREAVQSGGVERERRVRDEPRRELHRAHHPRDDHAAVLERLSQAFDRVAAELRELVEEQHPVVQQGSIMYLEALLLRTRSPVRSALPGLSRFRQVVEMGAVEVHHPQIGVAGKPARWPGSNNPLPVR